MLMSGTEGERQCSFFFYRIGEISAYCLRAFSFNLWGSYRSLQLTWKLADASWLLKTSYSYCGRFAFSFLLELFSNVYLTYTRSPGWGLPLGPIEETPYGAN